jgi:hypothetical protein
MERGKIERDPVNPVAGLELALMGFLSMAMVSFPVKPAPFDDMLGAANYSTEPRRLTQGAIR